MFILFVIIWFILYLSPCLLCYFGFPCLYCSLFTVLFVIFLVYVILLMPCLSCSLFTFFLAYWIFYHIVCWCYFAYSLFILVLVHLIPCLLYFLFYSLHYFADFFVFFPCLLCSLFAFYTPTSLGMYSSLFPLLGREFPCIPPQMTSTLQDFSQITMHLFLLIYKGEHLQVSKSLSVMEVLCSLGPAGICSLDSLFN